MGGHSCHHCVYSVCDLERSFRLLWLGEPIVPRCANHPQWPGQLHDVPGVPCRNYRPRPILPEGDNVRLIPLGDGFYAYVDAADYDWLGRHTWHPSNGYASRREKGRRIYMHREIMRPPKGMVVDHIDGNMTNDCRFNLRVCTRAENQHNKRKRRGARSRFKGVFYCEEHRKWWARCRVGGRVHWRGYFDDEVEAARAYDRLAVECFGIYARVNFPKEWPPQRRQEVYAHRAAAAKREGGKRRTEDGRRRTAGEKKVRRAEGKKAGRKEGKTTPPGGNPSAKGKSKKPRAETRRRREGKRRMKVRRAEGKKARAVHKPAGGTSKSLRRKTRRKGVGGSQ